jgi:hypothetical protein
MCRFHVVAGAKRKALGEAPYKLSGAVAKLAYITFRHLAFSWIRLNLGFLLRENLLLYSSYLPLGVPNWMVKLYQHRVVSRSFPTAEYSQTARRTAEYRLVGRGMAEFRKPAGGLARGGAGGDRATRGGRRRFATRL